MKKTLVLSALALVASSAAYERNHYLRPGSKPVTNFSGKAPVVDMSTKSKYKLGMKQTNDMDEITSTKNITNTFDLGATTGGLRISHGDVSGGDDMMAPGHTIQGHTSMPSFSSAMGLNQSNSGSQYVGPVQGASIDGSTFAMGASDVKTTDKSIMNVRGDTHDGDADYSQTDASKTSVHNLKSAEGDVNSKHFDNNDANDGEGNTNITFAPESIGEHADIFTHYDYDNDYGTDNYDSYNNTTTLT